MSFYGQTDYKQLQRLKSETYKGYILVFEKQDSVTTWTQIFKKGDRAKILSSYLSGNKQEGLQKGKDFIDSLLASASARAGLREFEGD